MKYNTIGDIYEANDRIREKLRATVGNLTDAQADALPEGEKWTVREFVEHIAIVDEGIMRISAKLLNAAREGGKSSDGAARLSDEFLQKAAAGRTAKFEAPDRVRPTGTKSIAESLARMDETRRQLEELRPLFESVDGTEAKFPHPAFGDLSAQEWLALLGGHEMRHIKQIEAVLEKLK
ncbi:MAG: DinB family protein [Acidobacteria bacterium]|nr:DinB family protein [Acidobacteriota bacterium]